MEWAVPTRIAALEGLAAAAFVVAAVLTSDPLAASLSGVAAILLAAMAIRDRVARVRLAADAEGVTLIAGFAARRRIPWSDIVAVRVAQRSRRGRSTQLLEIDTGEALHLLSAREMGADPDDVAAALDEIRP